MKSIKKALKTERLQFIDEYCDHNGKQFQKMIVDGKVVCPRCETESLNQAFEKKVNEELSKQEALSKYQVEFRNRDGVFRHRPFKTSRRL